MFRSLCTVQDVKLTTSRIPGMAPGLIIERSRPELVTMMVPEYSQKTVTVLLDLLYQGQSRDCGDLDRHGKAAIVDLYR